MPSFSRLHMHLTEADTSLRIVGEVQDSDYKDQIGITRMSWGMDRGRDKTAGRNRGRAEPGEFSFSKMMDRASTQMLTKLRYGKKLKAVVTLDSQEQSEVWLTITFLNARLTSYELDATDDEKSGEITEKWAFTYSEVTLEYMPSANETLTTTHKKTKDATSESATLDSVLESFAALNTPKQIDVSRKLKEKYPKLFAK